KIRRDPKRSRHIDTHPRGRSAHRERASNIGWSRQLRPLGRRPTTKVGQLRPLGRRPTTKVGQLRPLGRRPTTKVGQLRPLGRRPPPQGRPLRPPGRRPPPKVGPVPPLGPPPPTQVRQFGRLWGPLTRQEGRTWRSACYPPPQAGRRFAEGETR